MKKHSIDLIYLVSQLFGVDHLVLFTSFLGQIPSWRPISFSNYPRYPYQIAIAAETTSRSQSPSLTHPPTSGLYQIAACLSCSHYRLSPLSWTSRSPIRVSYEILDAAAWILDASAIFCLLLTPVLYLLDCSLKLPVADPLKTFAEALKALRRMLRESRRSLLLAVSRIPKPLVVLFGLLLRARGQQASALICLLSFYGWVHRIIHFPHRRSEIPFARRNHLHFAQSTYAPFTHSFSTKYRVFSQYQASSSNQLN